MSGALVLVSVALLLVAWPVSRAGTRVLARGGEQVQAVRRSRVSWGPAVVAVPVAGVAAGIPAAVATAMLLGLALRVRRRKAADLRRKRDDELLRRGLSAMIAELSVGTAPERACAAAAADLAAAPEAVGSAIPGELARMAARAELGAGVVASGAGGEPGLRALADAWHAAAVHGLALADLLGALRDDLVARRDFAERTRAGLAGPRATALVLSALPLLGLALGEAMGARPVAVLLGTGLGGILLVIGVALTCCGVLWSEHIVGKAMR